MSMLPPPPPGPEAVRGARLVRWSRWLLLVALAEGVAGCGLAAAVRAPLFIGIGAAAAFLTVLAAAIIGQVGRALQGRVI